MPSNPLIENLDLESDMGDCKTLAGMFWIAIVCLGAVLSVAGAQDSTSAWSEELLGTHEDANDYLWDANEVVDITLLGDSIQTDSDDVRVKDRVIKIKAPGTYRLSGTLTDMQIEVNSDDNGLVRLILNGVNLTHASATPLYIKDAERVMIVLVEDTNNVLQDGRIEGEDVDPNDPDAVIYSKQDLTICGLGRLSLIADVNDGIVSKDGLILAGGIIDINAVDDGIRGKDYLVVRDVNMVITALGDGLISDNDSNGLGYIALESGILDVNVLGDAITAENDVIVMDANLVLIAGGGVNGDQADPNSAKGIKSGGDIFIYGGIVQIDAYDDGLNASGCIDVNGGQWSISSGDDGIHADDDITLRAGEIEIVTSYQGLDCADANVVVTGGELWVNATNDGIDVARNLSMTGGNLGYRLGRRWLDCRDGYLDYRGGSQCCGSQWPFSQLNGQQFCRWHQGRWRYYLGRGNLRSRYS